VWCVGCSMVAAPILSLTSRMAHADYCQPGWPNPGRRSSPSSSYRDFRSGHCERFAV
jgi:hypothetical protein